MFTLERRPFLPPLLALLAALSACGGGGGSSGPTGSFPAAWRFGYCASPRTGTDPTAGKAYADRQGTAVDEKTFLRAWNDDLYLWYREVPDVSPSADTYQAPGGDIDVRTPLAYFLDVLKTPAITSSGHAKDRFHFVQDTAAWNAFSQSGVEAGYGILWKIVSGSPPREVVVGYVEPSSPADLAGIARGAKAITIDGEDVATSPDVGVLNAGLGPAQAGETHTFVFQGPPGGVALTSADVVGKPVHGVQVLDVGPRKVGYLLFNGFIATAEQALIDAWGTLVAGGPVDDLVLDMRYNGGGYLDLASELAFMIAGPGPTAGKVFEKTAWNDKHADFDHSLFFHTLTGFSKPTGRALPSLGLPRVFVLTTKDTCSASESVMNGLRGVGVEVIQVGEDTTCGKPFGFFPQDDCGTTYFSIQFQGVNAKGFGDYGDGFVPGGTGGTGADLPGCAVSDDLAHPLGDPSEALLSTALGYVQDGAAACPPAPARAAARAAPASASGALGVPRPWKQAKILRR